MSLSRGRITGFEALLRWLHPKHGIVLPEYFISTVQETGLINLIEQWLLHEACSQIKQWQEQFSSTCGDLAECPLTISVNLCTTRFSEENLLPHSIEILPLTHPVEQYYAEIRTDLEQQGKPIGANDLLITAHSLTLGLTLVTANIREFSRVPNLKVENWLEPR
ncbi:EAL domain-containing protein [Nostoc flagelliforme]|uniref:EAL domain-containing protein n=1 Tax=Nostoc flagelliforme TaxID=1306274 RepID=UPI001ABF2E3D|nr:EAL domain-containing protein [Nostoc flagelliforme]